MKDEFSAIELETKTMEISLKNCQENIGGLIEAPFDVSIFLEGTV